MPPRMLRYLCQCPTVDLIRSGVPEREVWVTDSEAIQRLLDKRHPKYLFSDDKNEVFFRMVTEGLQSAGVHLSRSLCRATETVSNYGGWFVIAPTPNENPLVDVVGFGSLNLDEFWEVPGAFLRDTGLRPGAEYVGDIDWFQGSLSRVGSTGASESCRARRFRGQLHCSTCPDGF